MKIQGGTMKKNNENGSSLIEVTVAMIILALLVTGLNACVVSLINSNLSSKELSAATASGYQLLEQIRRSDYDDVGSSCDTVRGKYLRAWVVTRDSIQMRVDLVVSWPLTTGKHVVELSTRVARP
jgi:Tfp pilus assembly protein PilV